MDHHSRALIVIPTYNEAFNLEPLVREIVAQPAAFDILVVDDNSPDGTGKIAERLSREVTGFYVLHRACKMGLGTACVEGFRWAIDHQYDIICEMDCDFSHNPSYLPRFLEEIESADLVIGSRYVESGCTPDWDVLRKLLSRGGNAFARHVLRLKTHDCTAGFRCYRRQILERMPWESIPLHGYAFQIGVVYHVERMGGKVVEFPIVFEDRRLGQSKMNIEIIVDALIFVTRLAIRNGLF